MGGLGSGQRSTRKSTTDDLRKIDIRWLVRKGVLQKSGSSTLTWSRNGVAHGSISLYYDHSGITFDYRHKPFGAEWQKKNYTVSIARTACHLGGERIWFLCPARGCERRAAILYGGEVFACRRCHNLGYESQIDPPHYRALSRAQGIRVRLGGSGSMGDPFPAKPKGMHWKTYRAFQRTEAQYDGASEFLMGKSLIRRLG